MAGETRQGQGRPPRASIPLRPRVWTICCFIIKRGVYKNKPICCQTNCQISQLLGSWRGSVAFFFFAPLFFCLLEELECEAGPHLSQSRVGTLPAPSGFRLGHSAHPPTSEISSSSWTSPQLHFRLATPQTSVWLMPNKL